MKLSTTTFLLAFGMGGWVWLLPSLLILGHQGPFLFLATVYTLAILLAVFTLTSKKLRS